MSSTRSCEEIAAAQLPTGTALSAMLSLGPALVALSLPSRTAHIKMQEAFSPLALLGDAYDGALNSLIGPLGLEEAGGAEPSRASR